MDRKRILWLSKGLDQGGTESLLFDLITRPELQDFDIEVAYVSSAHRGMRRQFEEQGVAVHDLRGHGPMNMRWLLELRRLQRARRYHLIHAHSPLPAAAARVVVGLGSSPPIVTTEHSLRASHRIETRLVNRATGRLDAFTFGVSDAVTADHRTRHRPVERLYHGRAALSGHQDRALPDLDGDCFNVLVIANLRPEKNLDLLLKALASARRTAPQLRLTIAGDGVEREHLQLTTAELGLNEAVTFLGQVPEARYLLPAFSALALSSRQEGLPVVVMEALQAGVPIVSTRVGGIPELVSEGDNGLLVPSGDAAALSDALVRISTEPGLRESLAAGALAASEGVDVAPAAARYAELYSSLLGHHAKSA